MKTHKQKAELTEIAVPEVNRLFLARHPELTYKNLEAKEKLQNIIHEVAEKFGLNYNNLKQIISTR